MVAQAVLQAETVRPRMASGRRLLDPDQMFRACYLAGRNYSAEEIAADLEIEDVFAVRMALSYCRIVLTPKPFGAREVSVSLKAPELNNLRAAASEQGIAGADRHRPLLEQLTRSMASSPETIRALLDPKQVPVFVGTSTLQALETEAARRKMPAAQLARRLLEVIAQDLMFDAVLEE